MFDSKVLLLPLYLGSVVSREPQLALLISRKLFRTHELKFSLPRFDHRSKPIFASVILLRFATSRYPQLDSCDIV